MYLLGILCLVVATVALPVLPDPPTLPNSIAAALQDSEIHTKMQNAATDSASVYKKDNEEAQKDLVEIASVVFPLPPQLPPFDYSSLKKQNADQKQKYEDSVNQKVENSKKEEESVFLEKQIKDEIPPNPTMLPSSASAVQDSEVREYVISVATDSGPSMYKKDNEEAQKDMVEIASVVIPPPPQLPPFDYSSLRKQKADQKQKYEDSVNRKAENSRKEEESIILEKTMPNPETVPSSVSVLLDSEVRENILNVATDSAPVADKKDYEEVKNNMVKETSIVIPPPPQLPPFDYSILRKQKADQKQKYEDSVNQKTENSKKEEEKPIQFEVLPKPASLGGSVDAFPVTEVRTNTLNVATDSAPVENNKDSEEVQKNIYKLASVVIPPPPQLPPLDYSILRKHNGEQKLKSDDSLEQEVQKSKKQNEKLILEKPAEVNVEVEPKLIVESKFVADSKPIVEFKPLEELKKEPVEPSEDRPVIIQWTVPSAPFLSKLISNYPPLPSFGLNWPFQRSLQSRRPRIIYPKFDVNGVIYTN